MCIDRKFKILAINPSNGHYYDEDNSFLFCAHDAAAPAALEAYIEKCEELGADKEQVKSARLLFSRVLEYQEDIAIKIPNVVGEDEIERCLHGRKMRKGL